MNANPWAAPKSREIRRLLVSLDERVADACDIALVEESAVRMKDGLTGTGDGEPVGARARPGPRSHSPPKPAGQSAKARSASAVMPACAAPVATNWVAWPMWSPNTFCPAGNGPTPERHKASSAAKP